ncbi:hypothetical protein JYT20_00940 [Rhodothermus sp. AH-315-K08]|nr:hypothetical protein [Rhodothermus sp. AH-315-K08]
MKIITRFLCVLLVTAFALPASGQTPLNRGSDNIDVIGHIPLGKRLTVTDIEMEQEMDRPFVYVSRASLVDGGPKGVDMIDISDPANPKVLLRWRLKDQDLHMNRGGMDVKYFKWEGRYYIVQSFEFGQGGPDADLGAVVLDVTSLPDADGVHEVARIRNGERGSFHNIFIYKHSSGSVLLLTTTAGGPAHMYDLGRVVNGDVESALVGTVPIPSIEGQDTRRTSYHDLYAAYHEDTGQDRFYGGGTGGYYVFNISDVENPEIVVTLMGVRGVDWGHTFTPSPDGRYVVAEVEYRYAPLRIFDLKPALDGEVTNINNPISAWTHNWKNLVHNHEVRWPFVFVAGYLDGFSVFSLMDPKNPQTLGYYDTYTGPEPDDFIPYIDGAFGVDVRNKDGLIVVSDMTTGLWTFRMDGFSGWNGEDWGQPDISSVQKWDEPLPGTN